jgi:membrane protein required for colicin V production
LTLVAAFLLKKFFKTIQLGWADKLGGFIFGALKSAVVLSIVLTIVITFVPSGAKINKDLKTSLVSSYLLSITPTIFEMLNKLPEVKKHNPFTK